MAERTREPHSYLELIQTELVRLADAAKLMRRSAAVGIALDALLTKHQSEPSPFVFTKALEPRRSATAPDVPVPTKSRMRVYYSISRFARVQSLTLITHGQCARNPFGSAGCKEERSID